MNNTESLTKIQRRPVAEVLKGLKDADKDVSIKSGLNLCAEAAKFGLNIDQYLMLAVKSEKDMSGLEMALAELNLPVKNDFKHGVVLQAASDSFQTFPGSRVMFPVVIDQILRWAVRQDQFEQVSAYVGSSRTMNGIELLSTVVNDDSAARDTHTVAEFGRIPVKTIRLSESSVKIYKHGSGIRTSYEFARRANLDILTPYVARIARELEISKSKAATAVLINGDGVQSAAASVNQSSFNTPAGVNSVNGVISWPHLLYWLLQRAKAGVPVDTVVGNWDSAFKWAMIWSIPNTSSAPALVSGGQQLNVVGGYLNAGGLKVPLPTFALSSTMTANCIMGITKAETLEELIESGSQISESERSITNQAISYFKTENTGYKLPFGDTRQTFNYGA